MARYSASRVRSRSSAPARTIVRASVAIADLLGDSRHVVGVHVQAVLVVDRDDRPPAAAAEALDGAQRELAIRRRLAHRAPELGLERLEHGLRADHGPG